MKAIKSLGTLVLAVVFAAPAAWAQASASTAAAQASAAAAAPAMPMPNAALDQLKFFVGTWHCTGMGYVEGKGHPVVAKAALAWELNGFFLGVRYEEEKTAANPMPVTAVEHWGYSDELKKLVAGQVDSFGGYGTQSSAGWDGNSLVWMGETHMMGMRMPSRDTFVKKGENELTHLGELQSNGAWIKQDEQACNRVLDR